MPFDGAVPVAEAEPADLTQRTKQRFLEELRHHLRGWKEKIHADFGKENFDKELADLQGDPVYQAFGFGTPQYVLVRLMGRVSISIGRRLGEIYDKVPRFVAQARFDLEPKVVVPKLGGKLELDVCIPLAELSDDDEEHVRQVAATRLGVDDLPAGLGIEVRYNFNPNDSARLRKDVEMAELVGALGYEPVFLVFSQISPRHEAIARLKRAGWKFLVGGEASAFMNDLMDMDFDTILSTPEVRDEVHAEVKAMMRDLYQSHAFGQAKKGEET